MTGDRQEGNEGTGEVKLMWLVNEAESNVERVTCQFNRTGMRRGICVYVPLTSGRSSSESDILMFVNGQGSRSLVREGFVSGAGGDRRDSTREKLYARKEYEHGPSRG